MRCATLNTRNVTIVVTKCGREKYGRNKDKPIAVNAPVVETIATARPYVGRGARVVQVRILEYEPTANPSTSNTPYVHALRPASSRAFHKTGVPNTNQDEIEIAVSKATRSLPNIPKRNLRRIDRPH